MRPPSPSSPPAAIQPHGWMAVLARDGQLVAYSANWPGADRAAQAAAMLRERLGALDGADGPASLGRIDVAGQALDVLAHRSGERIILEFEAATAQAGTLGPLHPLASDLLPQLQRCDSIEGLAQLAAAETRRLSGFARALVVRFDDAGHGEVLADALDPGGPSWRGHRLPAWDLPAQAGELHRMQALRVIPDAGHEPVPMVGVGPDWDPASLDLSPAALGSVAPVHLDWLRGVRAQASLSVGIVVHGRLWGVVLAHDGQPRHLDSQARAACEHLGRLLSLRIAVQQDEAATAARAQLQSLSREVVSHLADADATLRHLVEHPAPLLRLADASGAAVVLDERCWTTGQTPEPAQIAPLAQWIAAKGRDTWCTEHLAGEFPDAAAFASRAAGVLAISISQVHRHLVLWFRPERVATVRWIGHRQDLRAEDGRMPSGRSLETWQEQVRGRCAPWSAAQVTAAGELRHELMGIVLRRAEEMAGTATELGRANQELEAFSYTVSHDLRAPMRHIAGYVDLVQDTEGKHLSERAMRYLSQAKAAAAQAGHMVDALLGFARMGRAALRRTQVDTRALVRELAAEFDHQEAGRTIDWQVDPHLPPLHADPSLLRVAVRNLMGNAVKYTRTRSHPQVRITAVRTAGGAGLEISDNGVGFSQKDAARLFGVFQRLHPAEEFEGTGIGLASVRGIVERHGGTVWARGELGQGATFGFTLPEHRQ